jgi:Fe-S-cluster-containing dehydrogenase component
VGFGASQAAVRHECMGAADVSIPDGTFAVDESVRKKQRTGCKYCVYDCVFNHSGMDPVNKVGIWKKGTRRICVKKHSLQFQNNNGQFFICDAENMEQCHFYKPA